MPTARKSKTTSQPFSAAEIAAAKAAAKAPGPRAPIVDWSHGAVTRGGGVAATIGAIRRTRGPNKNPTKEQVAIRIDREVLVAFRAFSGATSRLCSQSLAPKSRNERVVALPLSCLKTFVSFTGRILLRTPTREP